MAAAAGVTWLFFLSLQPAGAFHNFQILTPTPEPSPAKITGYFPAAENVNSLTGLPVEQSEILNRRPVMVKISNYPPSVRPQAGLSYADVVFEYYIGEGMNRFLAVFYSQDALRAGSLRSGRLVDAELTSMYQGNLVYGSADPRVDEVIEKRLGDRAISHLEVGCPIICGASDTHLAPWIYVNTSGLSAYASKQQEYNTRPDLGGMLFDLSVPVGAPTVEKLGVEYSSVSRGEWHYNYQTSLYERWQEVNFSVNNMEPLVDQLGNRPITYDNIVIIFAEYIEFNPTLHEILLWKNSEGAPAIFFRDGVMSDGFWQVTSQDHPIQFFNRLGLPYGLKPGNTWIVIANNGSKFNQVKSGVWDLIFNQP